MYTYITNCKRLDFVMFFSIHKLRNWDLTACDLLKVREPVNKVDSVSGSLLKSMDYLQLESRWNQPYL